MLGAHSRTAQSLRIPQPRLTASTKPASVPSPTRRVSDVRVVVGEGSVEDDACRPLRMGRREQRRQRAALEIPKIEARWEPTASRTARTSSTRLERRRGRRAVPVRKPAATAVEQNQAGELRQPPQERRERRFLPEHLDVGSQPVGPHQVDRSVPHDLVGDVHLARSGVSRHRLAHCRPRPAALRHFAPVPRPMPGPLNVRHTACRVATAHVAPLCRPARQGRQDGGVVMEQVMEHAKVNGVELAYEVVGSGEPMLLIHGAHLADALQPLVTEPALERFQRIRYHRRGPVGAPTGRRGATSVPCRPRTPSGSRPPRGGSRPPGGHSWVSDRLGARGPAPHQGGVAGAPRTGVPHATPAGGLRARSGTLSDRYQAGDAEAAVHGFLALVGDRNWHATIEQTVRAGSRRPSRTPRPSSRELTGSTWTFGPQQAAAITCPVLSVLGSNSSPCSSRAASCSTPGSRPARTPTSSARPTCSDAGSRGRRQRSPPSCDGAGTHRPVEGCQRRAGPPRESPRPGLTAS